MLDCNNYKQEKENCQFFSQQYIYIYILLLLLLLQEEKIPVVGGEPEHLRSTFMNLFVHFFLAYMYHAG